MFLMILVSAVYAYIGYATFKQYIFMGGLLQYNQYICFPALMGSAKLHPVSCKDVRFHVLLLAFKPELKDRFWSCVELGNHTWVSEKNNGWIIHASNAL